MIVSVAQEVYIFLAMVLLGVSGGLLFDIFRIIRKMVHMNAVWVAVTDFIFWIFFSVLVFGGLLYFNNASLRWYEFLGFGLGGVIYFSALSSHIIKIFMKIISIFIKIIGNILKILLTPLVFLYKILSRPMIFIFKFVRKVFCGIIRSCKSCAGRMFALKKIREEAAVLEQENNTAKRTRKRAKKKNKSLLFWVVSVSIVAFFVNALMIQPEILKNKAEIEQLQAQLEYEKLRAKEVDVLKKKVETDEYIEKVARDKLGLIKENEKIFIDVAG